MAGSAVCCHMDRRAVQPLADPEFTGWARAVAEAIAGWDFLYRRRR
jgi:hypothetical protein